MSSEQGNERLSPGLAGEVPGSWSVRQSGGEAGVGKGRFPSPSERGGGRVGRETGMGLCKRLGESRSGWSLETPAQVPAGRPRVAGWRGGRVAGWQRPSPRKPCFTF